MSNEELTQRGYVQSGELRGDRFGRFESFDLGSTTFAALRQAGLSFRPPERVEFPFAGFSPPARVLQSKPDRVVAVRVEGVLTPSAVLELKAPNETNTPAKELRAAEQALYYGVVLAVPVAAFSNGDFVKYIDVEQSLRSGMVIYLDEDRSWNASTLEDLLSVAPGEVKDPTPLAEAVWQVIWHATKAEPKECLLTFVEIFMLKFLSDNLPPAALAQRFRFESMMQSEADFQSTHGVTQIEYYVTDIRPQIKQLFPDNTIADESGTPEVFGLQTLVSKTSIINGFVFLRSSEKTIAAFNQTFVEILRAFSDFGPLTSIDPEFKLRLYETFLRRSARQQRLGQFFTPRNIVQPMIKMAQLGSLPDGAVVLDPAAGVGGFVLEPLLDGDSLAGNIEFAAGRSRRRIRTIGVDVDQDLHILAKANALLHLAEFVRDPAVTIESLNRALANSMVLMNENEMLGSLLNPPRDSVDVILTNPPYVTKGSSVYREAAAQVRGTRNGLDLSDYFETGGLGVEALFLRYISGALRAGGRSFTIVPLGLLNRSEPKPKRQILSECNVVGAISLPRKAFFNTAQPTYILILERRHTAVDSRPDVFCAIARSTGETLDARRTPTPEDNDLARIAEAFVAWSAGDREIADLNPLVRIEHSSEFGETKRWDVPRFWNDDELVELGVREPPIERFEFMEEVSTSLILLHDELVSLQAELSELTPSQTVRLGIGDPEWFTLRPGRRVRHKDVLAHPGEVPVYSCFTRSTVEKGRVDREWLSSIGAWFIEEPTVTVNATGASGVGIVFVRETFSVITDDVIAVVPNSSQIDPQYLAHALSSVIALGDFQYEAKLYQGRLKQLEIEVPVLEDGSLDLPLQRAFGSTVARIEQIKDKITDLGTWTKAARLV